MKLAFAPLLGVMAISLASDAFAQETGSHRPATSSLDVPEGRSAGDAARAVYDEFAGCIVRRQYLKSVSALANPPHFENDLQTLPKLMNKECFFGSGGVGRVGGTTSVELTTNPISFRGSLFKALVLKAFARKPAAFGETPVKMTGDNSNALQFANCVVRKDPQGSMKVFKAIAGTTAEREAFGALKPQFDQCAGQRRIGVPTGIMIGFLAEAYYREASASKSTSSR